MGSQSEKQISKRLSYVLRHAPSSIGISLDDAGWVEVVALLGQLAKHGKTVTRKELNLVVENNSKRRFEFSSDGDKIRARQGHSIEIALDYEPITPPDRLFHGTAERFLDSIFEHGIQKQERHHVHLSTNKVTMIEVGRRHGKPIVLEIDSAGMHADGFEFYVTGNEIWLTDHVPPKYIPKR